MLGTRTHTDGTLPCDPVADFLPASQAVRFDFGFAVGPMVPASVANLQQDVSWVKPSPADAAFVSPAAGSAPRFVVEMFDRAAGPGSFKNVPDRGTQSELVTMRCGPIPPVSGPVGEFVQHLPGGRTRLPASTGATRNRFAPTMRTFVERGFQDFVFEEWFGFVAPRGRAGGPPAAQAGAARRRPCGRSRPAAWWSSAQSLAPWTRRGRRTKAWTPPGSGGSAMRRHPSPRRGD